MNLKNVILLLYIPLAFINAREYNLSADLYNRYVWRGTDFGNTATVQPSIETTFGQVTIGAWGAWALNGAEGGNECDLYATTTFGTVSLTLTDYFFPIYSSLDSLYNGDGLFKFSGETSTHIFELSASTDIGPVSILTATNLSGDTDKSSYLELSYGSFSVGFGNGFYSLDGKFKPVSIGISASRDNFSASYIINPDQETSFLVFGITL
ncbi:MAG: hypothetical protein H8E60_07695 [Candidatus Marinimicrobia bacterium]|nr:hypothetical protein [Candidatus Neomarinimicrobiota bacterium]